MARSIHSVQVMLLALVPAVGAMAYAVSDTMVKKGLGRMLLDQSAHKVPFRLYDRLRLGRITAPHYEGPRVSWRASAGTAGHGVSRAAIDWVDGFTLPDPVTELLPVWINDRERQNASSGVRTRLLGVSPRDRWHDEYAVTVSTGQLPWRYGGGPWILLDPPGFAHHEMPQTEVVDPV